MATDFRNGAFPRRGRDPLDGYLWLGRVFDKARAARDGTIHDYIYPCPMDQGVFERWGITPAQFEKALETHTTDDAMAAWLDERVSEEARESANRWLLEEKRENLDRQDGEEVAIPAG